MKMQSTANATEGSSAPPALHGRIGRPGTARTARVVAPPTDGGARRVFSLDWDGEGAAPESVLTGALAALIEECAKHRPEINATWISERAKVGRNTLRAIMRRQREMTDLHIADRVCVALGRHVSELNPTARPPRIRKGK